MCSVNVCMVCHGQSVQFPSQVALSRVDVGTTSAPSLCAHISRWWGMCVRKVYDIFTSFFFRPLSYFTKVRFPCYFLPSPLTIGGGVSWAEMLHQHVCCSRHSFLLMSVEETGVEWMGWRGTVALSFSLSLSLSGSLLHSTPFIATPTGPALRRSLPAFYRTADVTRLPVLCLFSPSTTVLPLYSWLMVPLCILLPFLWSVSFLPCLPFPALVVFTCTWASTLGRQWSRASMLQKKHKPLTVYQFALERL